MEFPSKKRKEIASGFGERGSHDENNIENILQQIKRVIYAQNYHQNFWGLFSSRDSFNDLKSSQLKFGYETWHTTYSNQNGLNESDFTRLTTPPQP